MDNFLKYGHSAGFVFKNPVNSIRDVNVFSGQIKIIALPSEMKVINDFFSNIYEESDFDFFYLKTNFFQIVSHVLESDLLEDNQYFDIDKVTEEFETMNVIDQALYDISDENLITKMINTPLSQIFYSKLDQDQRLVFDLLLKRPVLMTFIKSLTPDQTSLSIEVLEAYKSNGIFDMAYLFSIIFPRSLVYVEVSNGCTRSNNDFFESNLFFNGMSFNYCNNNQLLSGIKTVKVVFDSIHGSDLYEYADPFKNEIINTSIKIGVPVENVMDFIDATNVQAFQEIHHKINAACHIALRHHQYYLFDRYWYLAYEIDLELFLKNQYNFIYKLLVIASNAFTDSLCHSKYNAFFKKYALNFKANIENGSVYINVRPDSTLHDFDNLIFLERESMISNLCVIEDELQLERTLKLKYEKDIVYYGSDQNELDHISWNKPFAMYDDESEAF